MSASLAELEQQACTLLPEERAQLAEVLLESLHDSSLSEIESEWERKSRNVLLLSTEVSYKPTLQRTFLLKQGV